MLLRKEFYFVRHGQTDHNLLEGNEKGDHTGDISLNATGQSQAIAIEPLIATLPIETICTSPMKRAQETKEIIAKSLRSPQVEIEELSECSSNVWREMVRYGMGALMPNDKEVHHFIERVKKGLNRALELGGPSLIVAHGGVHWAVCWLMGIQNHDWRLENCGVVHFFSQETKGWGAKKLNV